MARFTYLVELDAKSRECPVTEVLQVCGKCGMVRTVTLDGHWSLDQLTLYSSKTDQDFLRKLGVKT